MKGWWIFFFTTICILALTNSSVVVEISKNTLNMFFEVLIPSLFFMMVILKTMELSQLLFAIAIPLQGITKHVLHSKQSEVPYLLSGMFLGFAANSLLVAHAYEEGTLSNDSASRLLYHMHIPTITFCVITCGTILNDIRYGFLIYFIQMLYCLIGYRFSRYQTKQETAVTYQQKNRPILSSLTKALVFTGLGLYQMAGYILLTSVLLGFALQILPKELYFPLQSIFEFASSAVAACKLSIPIIHRLIILSLIFGFGGFSGHLQVYTFLNGFPLRYYSYFALRVMQAITTAILTALLAYILL